MSAERAEFEKRAEAICGRHGWKWDGQRIGVAIQGGRHQDVQLDYFAYHDVQSVRLYSLIGPTRHIRLERLVFALEMSFKMSFGSLAVHDDMLVVVDTCVLGDTTEAELESTVSYLAETADQYEKTMFGSDAY